MVKKYVPLAILSVLFVALLLFLDTRNSLNFVENTPSLDNNQIIGIQTNICCSCPTKINVSQIGTNGWVEYQQGKNYSEQLPQICSSPNIGMCAPCSPIKIVIDDSNVKKFTPQW